MKLKKVAKQHPEECMIPPQGPTDCSQTWWLQSCLANHDGFSHVHEQKYDENTLVKLF